MQKSDYVENAILQFKFYYWHFLFREKHGTHDSDTYTDLLYFVMLKEQTAQYGI